MRAEDVVKLHDHMEAAGITGSLKRFEIFKTITIRTPACREAESALSELFIQTRTMRNARAASHQAGLITPQEDCSILAIVGPSHVGKTRAVKAFMTDVLPQLEGGRSSKPMVLATLSSSASIKTMWSDVDKAFGDPHPTGSREVIENRVATLAAVHETEIVAVDECQHLTASSRNGQVLADALKRAVQRSLFSLVLIGEESHIGATLRDRQVANRLLGVVKLRKCNLTDEADVENFRKFLAFLDQEMVARKIFKERSGLSDAPTWKKLFISSEGLVGVASKIVARAVKRTPSDSARLSGEALDEAIGNRDHILGYVRQ